ncbi:selection and upkeep of intraepithelial T-cells protein 1-like [Nycticebus coucang]|uniref:selection and upkeep of intraepithelial T-cells protein 1-like n=1 Tax=Nycticebus coucang TaxID=9470 RepID=UPI00234D49C5|nr:selection and upkeep of intraepithelial T-cells protein 1-like [Nycticebus coucang]
MDYTSYSGYKETLKHLGNLGDSTGACSIGIRRADLRSPGSTTSLEIQILMHLPKIKGLTVECNSEGWYPQPQMEWRDSRGEIILPMSKNHSRDRNMKMSLLLTGTSQENVTCYLQNPVTGQEEKASIVLSGLQESCLAPSSSRWVSEDSVGSLRNWKSPVIVGIGIVLHAVCVIVGVISLQQKERD